MKKEKVMSLPTASRPGGPLGRHLRRLRQDDDGMSTVEYAIGTIAAAAFGALLYTVVTGDSILTALTGLVERALSVTF
jgi:Flp pilus assembly pilin Flp